MAAGIVPRPAQQGDAGPIGFIPLARQPGAESGARGLQIRQGATDRGVGKDMRRCLTNGAGMGPQAKASDASFRIERQANVQSAATGARAG